MLVIVSRLIDYALIATGIGGAAVTIVAVAQIIAG